MKSNPKLFFIIVIIVTLILQGCSAPAITPVPEDTPGETDNTPKSGGKITLASKSKINLDPLQGINGDENSSSDLVFCGLVKIDGEGRIKPSLAESWDITADNKTYSFRLREDVKWHDGGDFKSADVVATFDKIMAIKKQIPKYGESRRFQEFDNVEGYDAPDEKTFTVILHKPDVDFLYDMTIGVVPSPKETVEGVRPDDNIMTQMNIGTGPFKVVTESEDLALLVKNEDYFETKPYFDEIEVRYFPDDFSRKEAFKNAEVDLVQIEPDDWGVFLNYPNTYLLQSPSRYFEFVALNLNKPIFSDVNVRRAMFLSLDREKMLQDTLLGKGMIIDSPILPFSYAFNSQIKPSPFNPSAALELLEEAGWKDEDEDGIAERIVNGKKQKLEFELLVNMSNTKRYQAALQIEKNLKDIGIAVKLVNVAWSVLEKQVMKKQFDAAVMGWKLAPNPNLKFMFSGSEIKSGYNFVSYSNPEFDEILSKAHSQVPEREESLQKAQEILSQELPYLFLYSPNDLWAISGRIKGFRPNPVNLYDSIHEWWIDETPEGNTP